MYVDEGPPEREGIVLVFGLDGILEAKGWKLGLFGFILSVGNVD